MREPSEAAAKPQRFEHLLYSELDAIQRDPSRPPDDRLDAYEEEQRRLRPPFRSGVELAAFRREHPFIRPVIE